MNIKSGAVARFNATTHGDKVMVGDRIMGMNGCKGHLPKMLASLTRGPHAVCKLRRMMMFRASIVKSTVGEKLGIDVDHASGDFLTVVAIGKFCQGDSVVAKSTNSRSFGGTPVTPGTPGTVVEVHKASDNARLTVDILFNGIPTVIVNALPEWLHKQACSLGPVQRYNQKVGPEMEFRVGDLILEVNGLCGIGGKVQDMLVKISEETRLTFLVRRSGGWGSDDSDQFDAPTEVKSAPDGVSTEGRQQLAQELHGVATEEHQQLQKEASGDGTLEGQRLKDSSEDERRTPPGPTPPAATAATAPEGPACKEQQLPKEVKEGGATEQQPLKDKA